MISRRAQGSFAEEGPSRGQVVGMAAAGALRGVSRFHRDNPQWWTAPGQESSGGIRADFDWRPLRQTTFAISDDERSEEGEAEEKDAGETNWNLGPRNGRPRRIGAGPRQLVAGGPESPGRSSAPMPDGSWPATASSTRKVGLGRHGAKTLVGDRGERRR